MAKSKTPSFILTLYLKTEQWQENLINKEFEKYRRIYNACIHELYKRYNHMKESKIYQKNCKYNDNGTIKKGSKDKWIYSNHYIKIKNIRKELYRRQREIRKQSHCKLANHLLILGDKFYVETMNYKGLQKRSRETTKNNQGKYNKKKRFGKSLSNKAPSMFLTILNRKLEYFNNKLNKINTQKVKASQYNHITNSYNKKELNERWNDLEEFKIQRDLYSAFLIMNIKDNLEEINRDECFRTFDNFKILHDDVINLLKDMQNSKNERVISSMGI